MAVSWMSVGDSQPSCAMAFGADDTDWTKMFEVMLVVQMRIFVVWVGAVIYLEDAIVQFHLMEVQRFLLVHFFHFCVSEAIWKDSKKLRLRNARLPPARVKQQKHLRTCGVLFWK